MESAGLGQFRVNGRLVDVQRGSVTDASGRVVTLRAQAAEVLRLLAARSGILVTKDELMQAVWPGIAVTDDSLVQCIKEVRKALGDENRQIIVTLVKRGYVLEARPGLQRDALSTAPAISPAGTASEPVEGVEWPRGRPRPAVNERPKVEVPENDKISIAVMPFENLNGDAEQTYFSNGIAEDIIIELGRFKELRVIGRSSAFRMAGIVIDVKDVAQRLRVEFLVVGSVRRTGSQLRMAVQLIDARSMDRVWADRWDRDLSDIFHIQDEITRMVVARVAGHAESTMAHRVRSRPTESLSAYDSFLRARECFGMYEAMLNAEPFLLRAIALDPGFATAHAMISNLSSIKYLCSGQGIHLDHAIRSGRTALNLDPEEPWANHAFGYALTYMRRLDEGRHYLDRAVSLNPNDVYILAIHALLMNFMGHADTALAEIDEALKRDPYAHDWFWEIRGSIQTAAGKYGDAISSFGHLSCLPLWTNCYLSICYSELGQTVKAHDCLQALRTIERIRTPMEVFSVEPYEDATARRLQGILENVPGSVEWEGTG